MLLNDQCLLKLVKQIRHLSHTNTPLLVQPTWSKVQIHSFTGIILERKKKNFVIKGINHYLMIYNSIKK